MITEKDWAKAIKRESKRKEFIDSINLKYLKKYVKEINYHPFPNQNFLMRIVPKYIFQDKWKTMTKIIIYPLAFSQKHHKTLEDFLGTLFHHEGFHAKEIYEENDLIRKIPSDQSPEKRDIYLANIELRANRNQIKYFNEKNSKNYKKMIFKLITQYQNIIKENKKRLPDSERSLECFY